jgi:hypothetical protein
MAYPTDRAAKVPKQLIWGHSIYGEAFRRSVTYYGTPPMVRPCPSHRWMSTARDSFVYRGGVSQRIPGPRLSDPIPRRSQTKQSVEAVIETTRGKEIPLAQYIVSGPVQVGSDWTHWFDYRGFIPQAAGFPAKVVFTFSSVAVSARGQTRSFLKPTYTIDLREPSAWDCCVGRSQGEVDRHARTRIRSRGPVR